MHGKGSNLPLDPSIELLDIKVQACNFGVHRSQFHANERTHCLHVNISERDDNLEETCSIWMIFDVPLVFF
jgi:hypothetical protein